MEWLVIPGLENGPLKYLPPPLLRFVPVPPKEIEGEMLRFSFLFFLTVIASFPSSFSLLPVFFEGEKRPAFFSSEIFLESVICFCGEGRNAAV